MVYRLIEPISRLKLENYTVQKAMAPNHDSPLADMAIANIRLRVKTAELYKKQLENTILQRHPDSGKVQSLTQLAADNLVTTLRYDSVEGVQVLLKSCPAPLLRLVSENPRLHYTAIRAFRMVGGEKLSEARADLDELVLENETFIRTDQSDWGLVTLDDAEVIFPSSTLAKENDTVSVRAAGIGDDLAESSYRLIERQSPPSTGFAFLDCKRQQFIKIQPSTESYQKTFNRLTGDLLKGLDWNNILIAGGMALSTLLCVEKEMDKSYKDNDIDLYIYGLSPNDATQKVKHVCDIWKNNLPAGVDYIAIKNAKTITLFPDYPYRRLQIILRLVKNPAAVLLNFDLDQCAIGYTGTSVLMLPRAARAVETGYSVFTMDLVHGHHLGDRREGQDPRIWKYASRGYGLRILPSYCESVDLNFGDRSEMKSSYRNDADETGRTTQLKGLKAVKMIAFMAEDMVHRFYLGPTKMTAPDENFDDMDDDDYHSRWPIHREADGPTGMKIPVANISDMDTHRQGSRQAHGRRGLAGFELFMRHAALWKFEQEGKLTIDYDSFTSITYDGDTYDDMPKYEWHESFKPEKFGVEIDEHNQSLFREMLEDLRGAINIRFRPRPNCIKDYFTRRIRRVAHSKDITALIDRFQLTVPIMVPFALETFMLQTFDDALMSAGITSKHDLLIPIHKPGTGSRAIPDVVDSQGYNVRYWLIDNITMWAGVDRRIDEIFETLWNLNAVKRAVSSTSLQHGSHEDDDSVNQIFYDMITRRVSKLSIQQIQKPDDPEVDSGSNTASNQLSSILKVPNEREQALFASWMLDRPIPVYRGYQDGSLHYRFNADDDDRMPPEDLYWHEGIDGKSDEWTEWKNPAPSKEDPAPLQEDALGETIEDAPRGLKRQREDSNLSNMSDDIGDS